ncbi:MAG: glycosyl hydrolase family 18 protein, partial [Firmicutes bacterium]|nr:glycosyl hydrolase family 18 protein [Bacillota bacterium]
YTTFIYQGKVWEIVSNFWGPSNPSAGDIWKVIADKEPTASYTFVFTKGSDDDILAMLDNERQRLAETKKVYAYLPSWGVYIGHEHYDIDKDLDYSSVTHLTYSFAKPIDLDKPTFDGKPVNQDIDNIDENTKNPGLRFDDPTVALEGESGPWNGGGDILNRVRKNLLKDQYLVFSLGGWSYSEHGEFTYATDKGDAQIDAFAQEVIDFMVKYDFDGVDIDWEYPLNDAEGNQYITFMRKLREKMTQVSLKTEKYYQLSCATTPNLDNIKYIHPTELVNYVDTVNFMAYDYHGGSFGLQGNYSNHNAPLYQPTFEREHPELVSPKEQNFWIDAVKQEYVRQGVPNFQLLMGVAFYSRSYIGVENKEVVAGRPGLGVEGTLLPGQAGGKWVEGYAERNDDGAFQKGNTGGMWGNGSNPYYRMVDLVNGNPLTNGSDADDKQSVDWFANDYTRYWDDGAQVPYLYSPTDKIFHTYDDAESIGVKVNYIENEGLAGAIIWDLSGDTRTNKGCPNGAFELSQIVGRLVGQPVSNDAHITNAALPDGHEMVAYDSEQGSLLRVVGKGDLQVTLEKGPDWLKLEKVDTTSYQLSGTPQTSDVGPVSVLFNAVGDTGVPEQKNFQFKVLPKPDAPVISTSSLPNAYTGTNYSTLSGTQIQVDTEADKKLLKFFFVQYPEWMTISSTGQLGGTPVAGRDEGTGVDVTIKVEDNYGQTDEKSYKIDVITELNLQILNESLPDATEGQDYSATISVTGAGSATVTIDIATNPNAAWLRANGTNLSGTPGASDVTNALQITVQATAGTAMANKTFTIRVLAAAPGEIEITFDGNLDLVQNQLGDIEIVVKGQWTSISASGLPNGLSLTFNSGVDAYAKIIGYPSVAGDFDVMISVENGVPGTNDKALQRVEKSMTLSIAKGDAAAAKKPGLSATAIVAILAAVDAVVVLGAILIIKLGKSGSKGGKSAPVVVLPRTTYAPNSYASNAYGQRPQARPPYQNGGYGNRR